MAKKKTNKNYDVRKMANKFDKYMNLSEVEMRDRLNNMSPQEKGAFLSYCLAGVMKNLVDVSDGNDFEKAMALSASTKIKSIQVMDVLVVYLATQATTAKQLLDIITNINTYRVDSDIRTYEGVGKCWFNHFIKNINAETYEPFGEPNFTHLGLTLCSEGIATLTPYGVLWNVWGK